MQIKIGTAPVSWGIMEISGWGRLKAFSEVLDEMVEAGYEGTELGPYGYFPTDPVRLTAELSSRGLQLVSAFVPVALAEQNRHETNYQRAMKTAELIARSGARSIVLADEMNPARMAVAGRAEGERNGMTDRQWEGAAKILTRIAGDCRNLGLAATFHHHAGTFVETPGEVERFCSATDPSLIGLCLDTGHYYYGGGDPVGAVRKYGPRIRHLHLKDIRREVLKSVRRAGIGFLDAVRQGVFCELGEGALDFPKIVNELKGCGYHGWAIFEQDVDATQPGVNPSESAARSREYLRKTLNT